MAIATWKPDIESLIKMQSEHDATSEKKQVKYEWVELYSQDMFDLKIPPEKGMKVLINKELPPGTRIKCFEGETVDVIGVSKLDERTIITFSHPKLGVGCAVCEFQQCVFLPITLKTPEEKQVDDLAEFINKSGFTSAQQLAEELQKANWLK